MGTRSVDHLAQEFEIGQLHTEAEVKETLTRFHPDHAALRRYLVEEPRVCREAPSRSGEGLVEGQGVAIRPRPRPAAWRRHRRARSRRPRRPRRS
ncbi:DUF2087 domain-containing protein [Phycicoccus elongatus]|uniref:DUF2087 domain-containing protein n=1 Tax=Phycicoccus elongatus TaxID=101689 RepID=UPI000A0377F5|nr:DUF2087 domain-containing protein [Phycicoccus elongatus]MBK8730599.1 DUF2087 domain-containing protein [Tetrasphaera sp.]